MPLPTADTPWPPVDPTVQTALADWDAWYSSEPERLAERYRNRGSQTPANRPAQYAGGVRGKLARWFWGEPTPAGETVSKLHIPLAGDIARTSSGLLFSEPPALIGENDTTQTRLDAMAKSLHPTLLEAGELAAAHGGAYLRVVWDTEVSDRPWIDVVAADRAAPEFRYGRLTAVTFWTVLDSGDTSDRRVFRHLERHEKGRIYHGLYEGSSSTLGAVRPLADHPATAPLSEEVDAEGGLDTGAPQHLTASYMPNVRPARAWRHVPSAAYWGQSDFQGIEGLMDALDEAWTSWMRDIQDGKSRIIVADSLLQSLGPGQGVSWEDRRVYTGLSMLPRAGDPNPITSVQFAIRVKEHADTCAALVQEAARQAGYSAGTFGEHGEGQAVTATEIKARERRSLATRARKALYADPALSDILAAQLAVEAGFRFGVRGLDSKPPEVEFQDSISEGVGELATTAELLRRAEAASTQTLVEMLHPDWDKDQVRAETDAILGESGRAVSDPTQTGAEGVPDAGVPGDGGEPRGGGPGAV
ncbi:capsid protein [Streptomyces albipurpureus]|uniref:Capsid protein n=1 Tax=Streptomyces albipurpureus TaxID=2897419 RepID=A0ABT0V0U1_9ACTN|nr:capsid protein [Streptomyces sp. CWNU-1]MCM2394351.1 capsid protein [Streptomyces sp. CWNU-1]